MDNIINLNPIRTKRKVLTKQETEKLTKTKEKDHSQSTPKSKSLSEKVLLSPLLNDENIKKSKNKKTIINLSELNLNQLVPLEYIEFPSPESGKKPNYLSKSLFLKGKDFNMNYYQKRKQSPIFQYYNKSPIIEQVINERLNNYNNNFSFFMKQMKNEENDIEKINENEEILGFNKDSSSDDDDDNSNKLTSFVKEVLKNNERQEENNKNNSFGFDFNDNNCNYNNFLEDNLIQSKSEQMNVNININNNSNNNNYYYQIQNQQNNQGQNIYNQNNNFQMKNNYYNRKRQSDNYLHFQNQNPIFINNNTINPNINNQDNSNFNNIYYNNSQIKTPQINYYQPFINQNPINQMNYYYNYQYNQNYNNNFIRYNFPNPYRSNSSNNITQNLNIYSPIRKNHNINYLSLSNEELAKQAHNIAKIQSGCRYLEKKIEDNPELVENLFFNNILSFVEELSNDQFGNYFIKKIFNYLSENKILQLIAILFPVIQNVATNLYGTRVLQELIDYLKSEKLLSAFIKIIIPYIGIFINDSNGIHIIYKLINIDNPLIENIHFGICNHIQEIAINKRGCSFLKKYFEIMKLNKVENVVKVIEKYLMNIITDQYGNYLIQNIILFDNKNLKENIVDQISENIIFYSNQKFSSNVVEKCFEDKFIKDKVIKQILIEENFKSILLDNFGNYVIQKAILSSDEETQDKFFKMIIPLIPELEKLNFGQKLLSKLLIQHSKFSLYMLNIDP